MLKLDENGCAPKDTGYVDLVVSRAHVNSSDKTTNSKRYANIYIYIYINNKLIKLGYTSCPAIRLNNNNCGLTQSPVSPRRGQIVRTLLTIKKI